MKIILCALIDRHGHLKYVANNFKPNDCDICVSNYKIGSIGKKTLYYTLLDYDEQYANETCWTTKEVLRRCEEYNENSVVKIFTEIQNFYDKASEFHFAFTNELLEYDEEINMEDLKEFSKNMKKEVIGNFGDMRFFKYTKSIN